MLQANCLQQQAKFSRILPTLAARQEFREGEYNGKVTLKLKKEYSQAQYGSYDFLLEVPGFGKYPGHMAANGLSAAMYFALEDQSTHDFGTGISQFSKNTKGQWQFHKFYFEPQFKGGN